MATAADFTGTPVCITKSKNGKFCLDQKSLERVFGNPQIQDKPVMVVSVCGAFRKGKSFILCFLLRYLQENGYKNPEWLGKSDLNDGFTWKGGNLGTTQGIHVWNQPFLVLDNQGKQIVVFLMDTQGLFDNNSSKDLCTKIFVLSTLISSVQVFNLSQQIQEDNLEYLDFFTSVAALTQRTGESDQFAPFQKMVFLMRDWQHAENYDFGCDVSEGGYLDEVLKINKHQSDARKTLKKSFGDMSCFFLPHPGKKVAETRKGQKPFQGALGDIDEEFIEYAMILADFLLHPERLVPKAVNGRPLSCGDLISYALECNEKYQGTKLPTAMSMKEGMAVTLCIQQMEKCEKDYTNAMNEKCIEQYVTETELEKMHDGEMKRIEEQFAQSTKLGLVEIQQKYRQKLKSNISVTYERFLTKNENIKNQLQQQMRGSSQELLDKQIDYLATMTCGGTLSEEAFQSNHEAKYDESKREFIEKFSRYPGFLTFQKAFQDEIQRKYQAAKIQNSQALKMKLEKERLQKDTDLACAAELQRELTHEYKTAFKEYSEKYEDETVLRGRDKETVERTLQIFDGQFHESELPDCLLNDCKNELVEKLRKAFGKILAVNQRNKDVECELAQQASRLKEKYIREYKKALPQLGDPVKTKREMKSLKREKLAEIRKQVDEDCTQYQLSYSFKSECKESLEEVFIDAQSINIQNEIKLRQIKAKADECRMEILKEFRDAFSQFRDKYVMADELEKKKNELHGNDDICKDLKDLVCSLESNFSDVISAGMTNRYVEPEVLDLSMAKAKAVIFDKWDEDTKSKPPELVEMYKKMIIQKMERDVVRQRRINEDNKNFYKRKVTDVERFFQNIPFLGPIVVAVGKAVVDYVKSECVIG